MVSLVDRMLDLHKKKAEAKSPADVERIERMIAATDSEIDALVYQLGGLTEEAIKIVEGKREDVTWFDFPSTEMAEFSENHLIFLPIPHITIPNQSTGGGL